ncbi:MAG TPA: Spy/CpxP family protein refolding chaperone [Methylocystis sp.]|nr:Spy/CpxP family protein refolding chaperone [Methylocystis sp.]
MRGDRGFHHRHGYWNAFGGLGAWYGWNNAFWGGDWYDWGEGWGYWAGGAFWPFLYGDALTYVLWPDYYDEYYNPFFAADAYEALLASVLWPGPASQAEAAGDDVYGYAEYKKNPGGERRSHRTHYYVTGVGSAANAEEAGAAAREACGGLAPGVLYLPVDAIERAVRPNETQLTLFNDLRSASAQAENTLRASCPKEAPLTPVGRLDAAEKRLEATKQAVQTVRQPLTKLYDSLDAQQKGRFAEAASERRGAPPGATKDLGGLCKAETENFANPPLQRIEEAVKPTEAQKSAFEGLKTASNAAAQDLKNSCPAQTPQTTTARLDMVVARLDALIGALDKVKPALAEFYNSLNDEQKARFNLLPRGGQRPAALGKTSAAPVEFKRAN